MHLNSINAANLKTSLKFCVILPWALLGRLWDRDVWIITERQDQARDNGYVFFKYVREKYPKQKIAYIINKSAPDYAKIRTYGSIIQFDSWAHYYYYCLAKIHISSHVGGCKPSNSPITNYIKRWLSIKDIFLPHGVSYGISEFCLKKYAKLDLFICSGKPEYDNVLKNYGYSEKEVAYTGFPRLDIWHNCETDKKRILVMPTWRLYLAQNPNTNIKETNYYRSWQKFLDDTELHKFLIENGLRMIFYPHHNMKKYITAFSSECECIEIADEQYDIQELLKSAALLVTDYSSVHFDFAYMKKPVIYYQFDQEEFFDRQYKQAEFEAEKDGFGPVTYDEEALLKAVKESFAEGFQMSEKYYKRMRNFYQIYDDRNCERVYKSIAALENGKV